MVSPTSRRRRAAAALLAAALTAAACGPGDNQSANRNGSDTTSADTSATGPFGRSVGDRDAAMDSGFAAGKQRLDSLRDAGVTPANGIDSAGSRVQATTANEPNADTSRLNNNTDPNTRGRTDRRTP